MIDEKDVRRVGFGDEASRIEHQGIIGPGVIGFQFREDRLNQIIVVNLRVEAVRRKSTDAAGDEFQSCFVVDRRLVFGEHDQRWADRVESWVHA